MWDKVKIFLEMIKFEHTLFALPFAYMGAILGGLVSLDRLPMWSEVGWITLAMVGARTAAMSLNRLIDWRIDAKNPRTVSRALPAGLLSVAETLAFIIVSFVMLFWAAFALNELTVLCLPIAVFLLVLYSYTKRFTWLCHYVLGFSIGLAPLGGWIAVTGEFHPVAILLYITVALWIAGFDIIYACQDAEFDAAEGLFSIPSRFGIAQALWISRISHTFSAIGLLLLYALTDLSVLYGIGALVAVAILFWEHRLVRADDLGKVNMAFFTMNGILSIVVFSFTLLDVVVR
jgi:4-hydroxybenzoate polyprenyltransferase